MTTYIKNKKFRGQPVKIAGNRAHITIKNAQPQRSTPPTVGLSDALLEYIDRYNITLYVTVEYPKASFKTTAREWLKGAKKEEQPSYYNIPWYIYRKPIPKTAFKLDPSPSPAQREMEEKRQFYQMYNYQ